MVSLRRKVDAQSRASNAIPEQTILDAAHELLIAVGMRRMTMTDIARHAQVSRATLYRRWSSVDDVVGALFRREWAAVADAAFAVAAESGRQRLVLAVVSVVRTLRVHPIQRKIIDLDPEFLIPFLLHRRGWTTDHQLDLLERSIAAGAADGSIRAGDVGAQARTVLLMASSFTLTAPILVEPPLPDSPALDALDAQLGEALDRYLRP